MTSFHLIVLSVVYLIAIAIAFPLSYKGIVREICDLEVNYQYHLSYLGIAGVTIIISDLVAFYNSDMIQDIIA